MAKLNSRNFSYIGISDDATTTNLRNLTDDAIGTVDINDGYTLFEQTAAGDAVTNYEEGKPNPSVVLRFRPTTDSNRAVEVLRGGGERAFDLKAPDGGSGSGYHLYGVGRLEGVTRRANINQRTWEIEVTIRPVGTAWTEDSTIS